MAGPLEKGTFLKLEKKPEKNVTTKLVGGGVRALMLGLLKKRYFAASQREKERD